MSRRTLGFVGLVAVAALGWLGPVSIAGAETITSGGWQISFPNPPIGLSGISVQNDGETLVISEKDANFTNTELLPIVFKQVSSDAASSIVIQNEAISNSSGIDWSSFQFQLVNDGDGAATFPDPSLIFAPPSGYTGVTYASDLLVYTGSQPDGAVTFWGIGSDGDLTISADPTGDVGQFFIFKEEPIAGDLVPLPAALWQGLVGLGMLSVLAIVRRMRMSRA